MLETQEETKEKRETMVRYSDLWGIKTFPTQITK